MIVFAFVITFLFSSNILSQHSVLSTAQSAASRGAGQTGICQWTSNSAILNPGQLAFIETNMIQLESHNYFLIKGLFCNSIHSYFPIQNHSGFGIHCLTDGSHEFKDVLISGSFGKKLNPTTGLGISLGYITTKTSESSPLQNFYFDIGLQTKLLPRLLIGFVIQNPIPIKFKNFFPYPSIYKFGLNYRVNSSLDVLTEVHKIGILPFSTNFGFIYSPMNILSVFCGINTLGPIYSFGLELKINKKIQISSSIEYHLRLSISPSMGVLYSLN